MQEEEGEGVACLRCLRGGVSGPPEPDEDAPTYEVCECPELGRYLVAARDLAPGQLVSTTTRT